jgi:hypothetical protein
VNGRGFTDVNESAGDFTICFQPESIEPSHVGFSF